MNNSDPGLLSAIWRYKWLVLVVTAFFLAMGVTFQLLRPQEDTFEAAATVVIQEPVASFDANALQATSAGYIRSQLEIMRSPLVFEAAAAILAEQGIELEEDLTELVTIFGSEESPLVSLAAQGNSEEAAIATVNAIAQGYTEVSQRQATATTDAQLARIDAQVQGINERLEEIDQELTELAEADADLFALQQAAEEAVGEIARLQTELIGLDGEEADAVRQEIEDYRETIAIFREVREGSASSPEQQALLEEQAGQVDRRALLLIRRDEVSVDAGLASDSVALVQQAQAAQRLVGLGLSRIVAVALVLGLGAGAALAYFLTVRHRTVTGRGDPEGVLAVPLLADIPDFALEGITSEVPVRDNPRSAAAEAYRFAAASTEAGARGTGARSFFLVSATIGHGKSTTVANVAIAAAIHRRSVLVVDCDFGYQHLSRMLAGETHSSLTGVTDYLDGTVPRLDTIHRIELGDEVSLDLMPRGTRPTLAAAALTASTAAELFSELAHEYDLVLIDGPPLLQVAYSSTLAELAQGLIVVVEHESPYSELADLRRRLDLVERPILGYVYNRSPLRREMTMTQGSMMDILGDSGLGAPVVSRRQGSV